MKWLLILHFASGQVQTIDFRTSRACTETFLWLANGFTDTRSAACVNRVTGEIRVPAVEVRR
jgi:hypothetical protein